MKCGSLLITVYGLIQNIKITGTFCIQVLPLFLIHLKMGNICLKTKKKRKNKDAIVIEEIEDSNGFEYLKPKGSQYQVYDQFICNACIFQIL